MPLRETAEQCTATARRTGKRCQNPAVTGYSVCRMHGAGSPSKGTVSGRPVTTGRYSLAHRRKLADKQGKFLNDAKPWDLSDELALMRALLQEYLERYDDNAKLPAQEIDRIFAMIETVSRLVERITKIINTTALTQIEVQYLQARLADLLNKYVADPDDRKRFLAELSEPVDVREWSRSETKRIIEIESD